MSLLGCHCFNETSGWIEKEKMYHHVGKIKEQGISCTSPIFQERQVRTHFSKWEVERGVSGIPSEMIFSVRVPAYSSQPELLMKWTTPLRNVLSLRALAWKKKKGSSHLAEKNRVVCGPSPTRRMAALKKNSFPFKSGMSLEPWLCADHPCCISKEQCYCSHPYVQKCLKIISMSIVQC